MKTPTSSSRASLVGHLELIRKEPAYDHMRALLTTIIDHLGINTGRKRKGQDDTTKPNKTHAALANSKFARVQVDSLPKLSVRSIFGPNSCPALDTSKTRWDKDRLGFHNPKPKIYDEASLYRANAIRQSANFWDGRSLVASPKDSLTFRTQEIRLSDEDQRDELLQGPRPELLRHAESLLSTNKGLALHDREPGIEEEDRDEQFPEAMSSEDGNGLELETDHPPHDPGNVQPEPVGKVPPQTRSRTRLALYRYPPPYCPGDDSDGGLLYDSYGVPMRPGEDIGNSSNQAPGTSKDKPNSRTVITTARTTTPRAPKDGPPAPSKGKASGGRPASRNYGPSTAAAHAAAMLDVWPPLSAPGATIFDQHDDASHNATTRPDLPEGDHPGDM
jgi:hypothetical protein